MGAHLSADAYPRSPHHNPCTNRPDIYEHPLLISSRGVDPETGAERTYTPRELDEREELYEAARWMCADCPLLADCLKGFLRDSVDGYSITAGLTQRQANKMRRRFTLPAPLSVIKQNILERYSGELQQRREAFEMAWHNVDPNQLAQEWLRVTTVAVAADRLAAAFAATGTQPSVAIPATGGDAQDRADGVRWEALSLFPELAAADPSRSDRVDERPRVRESSQPRRRAATVQPPLPLLLDAG